MLLVNHLLDIEYERTFFPTIKERMFDNSRRLLLTYYYLARRRTEIPGPIAFSQPSARWFSQLFSPVLVQKAVHSKLYSPNTYLPQLSALVTTISFSNFKV